MASYFKELISNYVIENPINKVVHDITNFIKYHNDYDSAIKLILKHNLSLEDIANKTIRLTKKQIIMLANKIISIKK